MYNNHHHHHHNHDDHHHHHDHDHLHNDPEENLRIPVGGTLACDWLIWGFKLAMTLSVVSFLMMLAQYAEGRFSTNKAAGYLNGLPFEDNYDLTSSNTKLFLYYPNIAMVVMTALSSTMNFIYYMLGYSNNNHTHHHADLENQDDDHAQQDSDHENQDDDHALQNPNHENHNVFLELLLFLLSFGALDGTAVYEAMEGWNQVGRIMLSIVCGLTSMWGNFKFHSHYEHQDANFWKTWEKMSYWRQFQVVWFAPAILIGHFFEGVGIMIFLTNLFKPNTLLAKASVDVFALFAGLYVLKKEGWTEFLLMIRNISDDKRASWMARIFMTPSAALHGLLSVLCLLTGLDAASQILTQNSLATQIDFYERLSLFIFSFIILFPGNSYGYAASVLPAVDSMIADFTKFLSLCRHQMSFQSARAKEKMGELVDDIIKCLCPAADGRNEELIERLKEIKRKLFSAANYVTCERFLLFAPPAELNNRPQHGFLPIAAVTEPTLTLGGGGG